MIRPAPPQSPTPHAGAWRRRLDPVADALVVVGLAVLVVVLAGRGL